jgi:hypothetical protein
VRRLDYLADVELVFQRDDFGSDMTTCRLGLLESVVAGESGHHVRMSGNEDPEGFTWDLRSGVSYRVSMRAMVFIRAADPPALSVAH